MTPGFSEKDFFRKLDFYEITVGGVEFEAAVGAVVRSDSEAVSAGPFVLEKDFSVTET